MDVLEEGGFSGGSGALALLQFFPRRTKPSIAGKVVSGTVLAGVGELLGDPKEFYLKVLDAFVNLFDFKGLSFDHAIRLYLESFFLPGEAQKIGRILEAFSKRYYSQCPGIFASAEVLEDTRMFFDYCKLWLCQGFRKARRGEFVFHPF